MGRESPPSYCVKKGWAHYLYFLSPGIRKDNCKRYPRFQYPHFQSTPALSRKTCSQQICRTARLRRAGCDPQPGTVQVDLATSVRKYFLLFYPVAHACNFSNPSFVSSQSCPCCWCQRPALSIAPMDDEGSLGSLWTHALNQIDPSPSPSHFWRRGKGMQTLIGFFISWQESQVTYSQLSQLGRCVWKGKEGWHVVSLRWM